MPSRKKQKKHPLVGAFIDIVEPMSAKEVSRRDWFNAPTVINLRIPDAHRTKLRLFPSSDPEGNDGGAIFGEDRGGSFVLQTSGPGTEMRGLVVMDVRPMAREKLDEMDWHAHPGAEPSVITLSDRTILYTSQDPEGNGPGAWVLESSEGEELI